MKTFLCFLIFIAGISVLNAQILLDNQYKNLQLLEKELQAAKTPRQKTDALIALYVFHSAHNDSINKVAVIHYQEELEIYTHQINDPELTSKALYYFQFGTTPEKLKKANSRLYEYAKLHNLNFYKVLAKIREAEHFFRYKTDHNRAIQILNEAINISKDVQIDTLKAFLLTTVGFSHLNMNNYLQALQYGFQVYEMATRLGNLDLIRRSYNLLSSSYRELENYHKALEYNLKELHILRKLNKPHFLATRHASIARLYFASNQPVLGKYHYKEAYRLADSVKGSKRLYNDITGMMVSTLSRFENKELLAEFLTKYRRHFFIFPGSQFIDNVTLARAHLTVGNIDSARWMTNKATAYLTNNESPNIRRTYYHTLAIIATINNDWNAAAENYKQCFQLALSQNDLLESIDFADSIKNAYAKLNNLPGALAYYKMGDSLQSELSRQQDKEDITRQEVAAFEKEKEMQAIAKAKEKQQRHNVQYLGITFGVVALFITLLLMGLFKVSARTIKILSFFSFLLFFEFIFLIFKKQIAVVTDGEPLMDLGFMVLLAAVMVPLHHWGEKKVVEYLSTKKLSFSKRKPLRKMIPTKEAIV